MIAGIGIDSVSIDRISKLNEKTLNKIFHPKELEECSSFGSKERINQFLAVRFAAKEAFLKALGCGFNGKILPKEIRVVKNCDGLPHLEISGTTSIKLDNYRIFLSLTHEPPLATAMVVLERIEDKKE